MMRGIAVPTTVWSTAESSMPSITATITAAMRLRLSVSPQGWGAAAAAAAESAAGAKARSSAKVRLVASAGGLRSGVFGRRLTDPEQTAEAAQQALELVRGESAEPALDVLLAALAQRGGELDGGRREGHQRAPAVPRVTLAHDEAVLLELVDQQAGARLAEAEMAAQRAHGLRAEHGDRHHGLELAHGEVERQPVGATCAGDHRKHPAGGLVAVLDEPGVWGGLGQRVLRRPEEPADSFCESYRFYKSNRLAATGRPRAREARGAALPYHGVKSHERIVSDILVGPPGGGRRVGHRLRPRGGHGRRLSAQAVRPAGPAPVPARRLPLSARVPGLRAGPRGGDHGHAAGCGVPGRAHLVAETRLLALRLRRVGHLLLRLAVGAPALAVVARHARPVVPHPRRVVGAGLATGARVARIRRRRSADPGQDAARLSAPRLGTPPAAAFGAASVVEDHAFRRGRHGLRRLGLAAEEARLDDPRKDHRRHARE